MTTYGLVLESGPKRMRTWVQVPSLAGCVFSGPTTDETVARAPKEIRRFLRLLARHGEDVDAEQPIEVRVDRHVTDSKWLGFGGPELEEDIEPLSREELEQQLCWATYMREEMLARLKAVNDEEFEQNPAKGRPLRRIVEHVAAAEYGYVRRFGRIEGLKGPGDLEQMPRPELMDWIAHLRQRQFERLRGLTDEELRMVDRAGSQLKTARAYVRKVLAHQYEHLLEIADRVGKPV